MSLAIVAGKFINNENTVIHINTVYKSSGEGEQCICISWVFVALYGLLALLARDLGHKVTGSDSNVYPPMSTQLENAGIELMQGYDRSHLQPHPDLVIVGNAMKRGIDAVEYMLNEGLPYISGPQFLADHVLQGKHVLGVAGTHGKQLRQPCLLGYLIRRV